MASHSSPREIPFGAAKLCQDIATLINHTQGDVQFKVGGILTKENGENIYDVEAAVILCAHSFILRCRSPYFSAMLDKNKDWKKKSKCIICIPNISPTTFLDVLHYIYTGGVHAKNSGNIIELITVANEMGLEELGIECQAEFIRTVKYIFSDEDQESTKQRIPINAAVRTHIIPALNLASKHSLVNFSRELYTTILPYISVIVKSSDTYTSFVNGISYEALIKIIRSDDLTMAERSIWDLALSWTCHQLRLSKPAVEARLNNVDYDEKDEVSSDEIIISSIQLNQLKEILTPLLHAIRFSLLDPEDYRDLVNILNYFLSRRQYFEIMQFFLNPDGITLLDVPRKKAVEQNLFSKIIVEPRMWKLLKKNIFETDGITGCLTLNDLKFELLFRASDHGFLGSTFHQRCDNKGPTLVIIRSADGHLFGGVNFNDWESDGSWSSSILNFLFALPDVLHRKDLAIFRIKDQANAKYSSCNDPLWGPAFGYGCDLGIANLANINRYSISKLPHSYDGNGASNTALAGSHYFMVSDYEVFAISKKRGKIEFILPFFLFFLFLLPFLFRS